MNDKSRSNGKNGNGYQHHVKPVSPKPLSPSTTEVFERNEQLIKRLRIIIYVLLILYLVGLVSIPVVLALG